MRQLIACFVTIHLALANGQNSPKRYEYADKDLLHSDAPIVDNKLVYGVCEGSDAEKKCKIYRESVLDESSAVQSCDLNLKYTGGYASNVNLQNAGKDHVVLAVKDGSKVKLVALNMVNCGVKETSIEPDANSSVTVVPRGDNYDVVFENGKLCQDFVCKATYDYDGKIVQKATAFGVKATKSSLAVNAADQGFLVAERRADQVKVHFVRDGDQDTKVLFSSPVGSPAHIFSSSTEKGKLGFCALVARKLTCRQYDAEGKTKNLEIERPISIGTYDAVDVLNLEKGLLVLTIEQAMRSNGQPPAYIVKYDEQGKQVKSLSADLNCLEGGYSVPKLYRNSAGEYCVASVCRQYLSPEAIDSKFSRSNKCFAKTELD